MYSHSRTLFIDVSWFATRGAFSAEVGWGICTWCPSGSNLGFWWLHRVDEVAGRGTVIDYDGPDHGACRTRLAVVGLSGRDLIGRDFGRWRGKRHQYGD